MFCWISQNFHIFFAETFCDDRTAIALSCELEYIGASRWILAPLGPPKWPTISATNTPTTPTTPSVPRTFKSADYALCKWANVWDGTWTFSRSPFSYLGLFVPSLDDSCYVARLIKKLARTMDVSNQNVPVYKLCRCSDQSFCGVFIDSAAT